MITSSILMTRYGSLGGLLLPSPPFTLSSSASDSSSVTFASLVDSLVFCDSSSSRFSSDMVSSFISTIFLLVGNVTLLLRRGRGHLHLRHSVPRRLFHPWLWRRWLTQFCLDCLWVQAHHVFVFRQS